MITHPEPALNALWVLWYASWIVAAAWSARTKTRMKTDMGGWHRLASGIGAVLLFCPSGLGNRQSPSGVMHLVFGRLWPVDVVFGWMLFALAALGFAFCWWARLHLGKLWSGFVTLKEGHRIVDTDPMGWCATPSISGSCSRPWRRRSYARAPAAFIGAGLLILGFSMTARIEEGFLRAQLGDDAYEGYRRRVGMLIPRLG